MSNHENTRRELEAAHPIVNEDIDNGPLESVRRVGSLQVIVGCNRGCVTECARAREGNAACGGTA